MNYQLFLAVGHRIKINVWQVCMLFNHLNLYMNISKRNLLKWTPPVVLAVTLPAHSQTTPTDSPSAIGFAFSTESCLVDLNGSTLTLSVRNTLGPDLVVTEIKSSNSDISITSVSPALPASLPQGSSDGGGEVLTVILRFNGGMCVGFNEGLTVETESHGDYTFPSF